MIVNIHTGLPPNILRIEPALIPCCLDGSPRRKPPVCPQCFGAGRALDGERLFEECRLCRGEGHLCAICHLSVAHCECIYLYDAIYQGWSEFQVGLPFTSPIEQVPPLYRADTGLDFNEAHHHWEIRL